MITFRTYLEAVTDTTPDMRGIDPGAEAYVSHFGHIEFPIDRSYRKASHVFRGVTSAELESIHKTGQIHSTGRFSVPGEGTCYGDDLATAVSYVNSSRDNPAFTGHSTYILQVRRGDDMVVDRRDGYPKAQTPVPVSRIDWVWRCDPNGELRGFPTVALAHAG